MEQNTVFRNKLTQYMQWIFHKVAKGNVWIKDSLYFKKCFWIYRIALCHKKRDIDSFFALYIILLSKWILNLITKPNVITFLEIT